MRSHRRLVEIEVLGIFEGEVAGIVERGAVKFERAAVQKQAVRREECTGALVVEFEERPRMGTGGAPVRAIPAEVRRNDFFSGEDRERKRRIRGSWRQVQRFRRRRPCTR